MDHRQWTKMILENVQCVRKLFDKENDNKPAAEGLSVRKCAGIALLICMVL